MPCLWKTLFCRVSECPDGIWIDPETCAYRLVKIKLCVKNDVMWKGNRIILSGPLRQRTLEPTHEGYQGVMNMKMLLRQKVWWSGLNARVENVVHVKM